ncbi:MAG: hypothetical protein QXK49_00730 [Candidatus Aenigmatarchaeota archaeon]
MTYSAMLRLSQEEVLIASDRTSTNGIRTTTKTKKIVNKGNYAVVNAGRRANAFEITERWLKQSKKSFNEELESFKNIYQEVYFEKLKDIVPRNFGITYEDYIKGNIAEDLRKDVMSKMKKFAEKEFETTFLFEGPNENKVEIYSITSPGVANKISERFSIIGSGYDLGEEPLYTFTCKFTGPIKRDEGLHAISLSLAHSYRNLGVGGIPEIAFSNLNEFKTLDERISAVSFNIARKEIDGKISQEDASNYFKEILDNNANIESLAKKLEIPTDYIISR